MCFHIMLKPILSMSCGTVMPSYDDLSVRAAESCYEYFRLFKLFIN